MTLVCTNALGQPIGEPVENWQPPPRPPREPMHGRYCRIEPLDLARHARDLYDAYGHDRDGHNWTYLPYGPFATFDAYTDWVAHAVTRDDPLFHAIVDLPSGRAVGVASYLRIDPESGSIEVGGLSFSPLLQRTPPPPKRCT